MQFRSIRSSLLWNLMLFSFLASTCYGSIISNKVFEGIRNSEVDYIVSQSTFTCLTIFAEDDIRVSECNGRGTQQWLISDGSIRSATDPSYYLVPNDLTNGVKLEKLTINTITWKKDKQQRFTARLNTGLLKAMEVLYNTDVSKVILSHPDQQNNQKWWIKSELDALLVDASPASYPFSNENYKMYKQELARSLHNQIAPITEPLPYNRDIATFPGLVPEETLRTDSTVLLDLLVLGQTRDLRMTVPEDWQATKFYAAAGDIIEVILAESLSSEQVSQIRLRIGVYTDFLSEHRSNILKQKQWKRMPIITETFTLSAGVNRIRSQYGGNIIFMFSEGENFQTSVQLKNVIETIYFKLGETTPEQWTLQKENSAPHAVFESEKTVIIAGAKDAKGVDDPTEVLSRYDKVISLLNEAAGFDENDTPPRGKYWILKDKQINAGVAHAGFPVTFSRKRMNLVNVDIPYSWGIWHELGHNYQQGPYWEKSYGFETTPNLFSLYIEENLFGTDRLQIYDHYSTIANEVDQGSTFANCNSWGKLVFLMEINNYFPDHKWDMYKQLRKLVRELTDKQVENLQKKPIKRVSWVYENLSKIVGYDLVNTYNRWSIRLTTKSQEATKNLPKAPADLSQR